MTTGNCCVVFSVHKIIELQDERERLNDLHMLFSLSGNKVIDWTMASNSNNYCSWPASYTSHTCENPVVFQREHNGSQSRTIILKIGSRIWILCMRQYKQMNTSTLSFSFSCLYFSWLMFNHRKLCFELWLSSSVHIDFDSNSIHMHMHILYLIYRNE